MLQYLDSLLKLYGLFNFYQLWIAKYMEKANIDRYVSGQLIKCLLGLGLSTLYFAWIRNEDFMGKDISDKNFFARVHHVHDPFFNNFFGLKSTPRMLPEVGMTWMDWFNCATLGYFGLWLKGHFVSMFSFPFLFSFIPFEMYLLYDLISTGMHWHVNGVIYYSLWALVLYHTWYRVRYPTRKDSARPVGIPLFLLISACSVVFLIDFWFEIGLINRFIGSGALEKRLNQQHAQDQHEFHPFMTQPSQDGQEKFRKMANFLREENYWQHQSKGSRLFNMPASSHRFVEVSDSDDDDEPPGLEDVSDISVE
ncbi:hypothetical protein C9374_003575 [Naegleria lovaniensis]|uniref:Uncharacterized protein n=1 Tax=Naegleria lovaniensis TaxID=51637 RepID=A0AA88H502_NAELO|nr:uncharacterized protein C9374_003575 [Naegleria lovaniensis]KAG2393811.1 hypothetical protein C9374_003575 [Naegleria lovaniensis]